eukprot:7873765-Heterocapsa_arctica.AAC.1
MELEPGGVEDLGGRIGRRKPEDPGSAEVSVCPHHERSQSIVVRELCKDRRYAVQPLRAVL